MKNILVITNIIATYRTTLFNEMYIFCKKNWYTMKVLFLSETENNRNRNTKKEIEKFLFPYEVLSSKQIRTGKKDKFYFHINKWIKDYLNKENPDIIIHDWWVSLSAWQSQKRCKKHKRKYILWNESSKFETSWRRTITKPIVKSLVKKSDWYISFWTRATEYLNSMWANLEKICQYYNTVDIDFFVNESNRLKDEKQGLKNKYWINTKHCILFVWQLIVRKWIYEILGWFKEFQKKNKDWSLVFVWWWQEKEKMENIIKEENITNVYFPWFFQIDVIPELYKIADIFTLPSREEVWWLVINEAMCFWLPIITANEVWASEDLVIEWKNWYVMKNHTPEEWQKWLNYIIEKDLINNNSSLQLIQNFKYDNFIPNIKIFLD